MKNHSPEFDAYIAQSALFARPILEKLRSLFHRACPDIEETMKWNHPHFVHNGIVASMAAFNEHVRFGFWKGQLLKDPHQLLTDMGTSGMSFSRITNIAELPADKVLLGYIREAIALNDQGVKPPRAPKQPRAKLEVPDYFLAALRTDPQAQATFEAFSPSNQREYVEWITEAKQPATRDKRIATALEWLAEGKTRHWKYQKKC